MLFIVIFALYLASSSTKYLLAFLKDVQDQWRQLRNPEEKRRRDRRQTFAEHIEQEIRRLSLKEDWRDRHFTELEAEVEAEGYRRIFDFIPFAGFFNQTKNGLTKSGLKRERSL